MKQQLTNLYSRLRIETLASLGRYLLAFFYKTIRWQALNEETLTKINGPIIFAFWHSRQLMMPYLCLRVFPKDERKIVTLISRHSDGRIIARAIEKLGLASVAGSSSKGGARALKQLQSKLNEGYHVAITPDGPRGPAEKAKLGVLQLASKSGATVLPVAYSAKNPWKFSSWDQMILPKPFSKGVYAIGEPLHFPKEINEDEFDSYLSQVESKICEVTRAADQYVN